MRRSNRRQSSRALSKRARFDSVVKVIELLEQRQLLSAVTAFPIPGQSADGFSWNGSAHITTGPDGNLWFTDSGNNQIDRVTPQGQITQFTLPGTDDPSPDGIVSGPDGNLWFTESGVDRIGRITPGGTITEFETPTADSNPTGIAVGSDGNLWFVESGTNDIGKITTAGKITEYPTTNLDLSSTDNMMKGSDGDVWFIAADSDGNSEIARVTIAGKVTAFPLSASPNDLTIGPDGNVWLASSGEIDKVSADGTVQSFTIPTGDDASAITTGPDGALWFALDGNNQIGRMTTAGTFSEYSLPEPGTTDGSTVSIGALTTGPDGNLWFTDDSTPQVGLINFSGQLLAGGDAATVTAGTTSSATLASFTDFSGGAATDYTATVTWSDNTTSAGTITANSSGGFDISASRDWTLSDDSATVTITDTRNTTRTATATANLTVNPPQATGTGVTLTTTAAQLFTGTVASFTGVALNSLSQYSATIDWGDGQVSNGTIAANGSGGVDVSGSNRYAASGSYTVTVNLSPYPGGFLYPLGGGEGIVPVAIGAPVAKTVSAITGVAKATATAPGSASAKSATSSSGVISTPMIPIDPLPPISDPGYATATSAMTVGTGVMNGTGFTIQASSTAPFSGNVATFMLTDPNADLSHFHATITWSDPWVYDWFTCSTPPTTGTITSNGNGGFTVSVATNFANYGLSHFTVSITDDRITTGDATVGVAYGQLCVDSPIRWLPVLEGSGANTPAGASATTAKTLASTAASNVNPVLSEQVAAKSASLHPSSGGTVAGNLGTLTGVTSTVAKLADLHGTINWGDGTTSAATFVKGAKGHILVRGNHKYAQTGSYSVSVSAEQSLYTNGKPSALYPLALPTLSETATVVTARPITTGGIAITAIAAQPFSGAVASFALSAHAVPSTQATTIFWGDGSHSTGTIDTSGNELTVTGSHTYRKPGKHHVRVIVTQHSTQAGTHLPLMLANIVTSAVVSLG